MKYPFLLPLFLALFSAIEPQCLLSQTPPTITTQPLSQTVYVGESVALTVTNDGTEPFRYQWRLNASNLSGESNAVLFRAAVATNDAGSYSVAISNAYGFMLSSNALLNVLDSAPIIQNEPASRTNLAGDDVLLQVNAAGSKPIHYQWRRNDDAIPGATNLMMALPAIKPTDAGLYQVVLSNLTGTATTTGAVLKVQSVVRWGNAPSVPEDFTNVVAISANEFSAVLRADGTASDWEGATLPPPAATNLVSVTAGAYHLVGIRADGTQFVWGNGCCGQLNLPVDLGKVVANAAGLYHSLAIKADGTIVHFGDTAYGQAAIPTGVSNVITAHSSDFQTLVAKADGTISIWGASPAGNFPPPADLSNVVAVATGWSHNLAVKRDRTLVMWGPSQLSQIPAAISNNVVAVSAKRNHSVALLDSGHAIWWGFNQGGPIPVPAGLSNVMAVTLGYDYGLALVGRQSPRMVQQPFSMTVPAETSALLLATAVGTQPMTYQWRRHGTNLPGETLPTLMLNHLQVAHSDDYSLVVSNALGWTESTPATLTVLSVMVVTQPTNRIVVLGSNVTFSAAAAGTGTISYRWQKDGQDLSDDTRVSGTTTATLSITGVETNDAGGYQLVATNTVATATSAVATLTVIVPPGFVVPPTNLTVIVATTATLAANVTGTEPLGYRWRFNGNPLSDGARHVGTTTTTLTISNVLTSDAGSYTLVASNFAGAFPSPAATLTVIVPPAIITQPRSYSMPVGMPVTFSAAASGTAPLAYQWLFNGEPVPNATNTSLVISNLAADQFGAYQFVVSNSGGSATSAEAQVSVGPVAAWGALAAGANAPPWAPLGLSNVIAISGGGGYSLALRDDGSLYAWGNSSPVTNLPPDLTNIVAVSGGPNFALALRADGLVRAWGGNVSATNVPASVSNVVAFAAGTSHAIVARADGSVVVWGATNSGQANIPPGLMGVNAVSAGGAQSLALRRRGTVINWGAGDFSGVPTPPGGLGEVHAIASGAMHHLALKTNGTLVTWGNPTYPAVIALPAGLSNIVAIAASRGGSDGREGQSLALRSNGTAVGWGTASSSGLGTNVPAGLSNVVAIALGDRHALAIVSDGRPLILRPPVGGTFNLGRDLVMRVHAVGNAPLGFQWVKDGNPITGATNVNLVLPSAQAGDAGGYQLVVSNALGVAQSLAVPVTLVDGAPVVMSQPASSYAWCGSPLSMGAAFIGSGPLDFQWLRNGQPYAINTNELVFARARPEHAGDYQLILNNAFGAATSGVAHITFTRVAAWGSGLSLSNAPGDLNDVAGVAAGGFSHGLLLRSNGTVSAWGTSLNGATNVPADLSNVVAIAGGNYFSVALRNDGTAVAWGLGTSGQTNIPASATNLAAVAAGASHALGLRLDGTVVAWGANTSGQTNVPASATNVVRVSAGFTHSLALRADGSVISWGTTPLVPTNLGPIVAIAAGYGMSAALQPGGTVITWDTGLKSVGKVAGLTSVVALSSAGASSQNFGANTVALKSDGSLVAWGGSGAGQFNVPGEIVSGVQPSAGAAFSLVLLNDRSPAITVQPWKRQMMASSNVTLTALAVGQPPLEYQWRLNGTDLAGATNASLSLGNINPSQAGNYLMVARNVFGVATSAVAVVNVTIPQPVLNSALLDSNGFSFKFSSISGVLYISEFKTVLGPGGWTELDRRFGVGGTELVTDGNAADAARYYRVRALFAPTPQLHSPTVSAGNVNFSFPTTDGAIYVVQYKTNIDDAVWVELLRQTGTGAPIVVNDPNPASPSRFYRVKVE